MTDPNLEAECHVFTHYLVDRAPTSYVSERYRAALAQLQASVTPASLFDRLLLGLARRHAVLTRAVDVYARFFAPGTPVRRRLVLLLAIIESDADMSGRLEHPDHAGLTGFVFGMAWRAALLAVILLLAIVTLLPVQLITGHRNADA